METVQHQLLPVCPQPPFPPLLGCRRRKILPDSAADRACGSSVNNHRRCPQNYQYHTSTSHRSEDTRTQCACSHLQEANLPAESHAPVLQIHSAMKMYSKCQRLGFRAVHEVDSSSSVPSLDGDSVFCLLNGELTSLFLQLLYWHCRAKIHFKFLKVNRSHSASSSSVVSSSTISLTDKYPPTEKSHKY